MGILYTILIGLIVGLVARLLHPGKDGLGLIMTALLGIAGSLVATYGGQALASTMPAKVPASLVLSSARS